MNQSTYHHRKMMDKQNLYQLSFYGDVGRMGRAVDEAARDACGDAVAGEGEEDGDGSSIGAGGGSGATPWPSSGSMTHRTAGIVNRKGGVQWQKMRNSTFSYLLHRERGAGAGSAGAAAPPRDGAAWRLRLVHGLPQATYEEYKASPLHFACAARSREVIILLLQAGCEDSPANFYLHSPLLCSHMLDGDQELTEVFQFWSSSRDEQRERLPLWAPRHHSHFPAVFKGLVRALAAALSRGDERELCNDLLLCLIGWMPSDVATLVRWWPKWRAR